MGSSYWGKDRRKMGFNLDIEIPELKLGFHLWVLRFGDLGVSRRFLFALFAENLQQTIFSNHSKASASLLSTIGNCNSNPLSIVVAILPRSSRQVPSLNLYMFKNKGFLPSEPSEVSIQQQQIKEIIFSLLPACKEPYPDSKVPFKADAIIANPAAYGHSHVAEALKIPIHIFFTMPWTPTSEFPHPLSRVKQHIGYRWERRDSNQYTQADIDQVRNEWGKFVVNTYVYES